MAYSAYGLVPIWEPMYTSVHISSRGSDPDWLALETLVGVLQARVDSSAWVLKNWTPHFLQDAPAQSPLGGEGGGVGREAKTISGKW